MAALCKDTYTTPVVNHCCTIIPGFEIILTEKKFQKLSSTTYTISTYII